MKKVLVITYYWPPSGGAGVQRWLKFTKYFNRFNIEPIVLTVDPNKASYPVLDTTLEKDISSGIKVYTTDTFEPYSYYKKLSSKKEIPYSGFANEEKPSFFQEFSRFIRGNLFIPDARKGWNKYALAKAREIVKSEKVEAIITTSPPHSSQLIGLKLKEEFNLPWLADLRDPWTDIYYYKSMNHTKWAKQKDAAFEQQVLEKADNVVVVSEAIKNMFVSKSKKINDAKIHIIPNGFDLNDFPIGVPQQNDSKQYLTYTGTLAETYNAKAFIDAFNEYVEVNPNVILRIVGKASDVITSQIKKENLQVIGHVPHAESIDYLQKAEALLLIIPDIKDNEGILTGKLFEYLAVQKPILALGPPNGDAAKIINECESGKMFDYNGTSECLDYLKTIFSEDFELSENNKFLRYSRENLTKEIAEIIFAD